MFNYIKIIDSTIQSLESIVMLTLAFLLNALLITLQCYIIRIAPLLEK